MEQTDSSALESTDPNGFVNKVFTVSLDVANERSSVCVQEPAPTEGSGDSPVRDRQEVNRRSRNTGGIWRILNRKRAVPELDRRPHSMILPGEAAIPKLSFADKVRSFKKLKSPSVFRSKGKLSTKFSSSLVDEESFCHEIGTPQQHSRSTLRHRSKRHSYAGYTVDFDCSFEDLDLVAPPETSQPSASDSAAQNGVKPADRVSYPKRNHNNSSNCNKAPGCEEAIIRDSPSTHRGAGRRNKDVWSYLRRISLLGKAGAAYSERSFDSELPSLDKTLDSDFGSVDFETVKDFQQPLPKQSDTKGHFGGLFKFFNSVAETARKWRTTTRSFSPPEGEKTPVSSPRAPPRTANNIHSVSLSIHSDIPTSSHTTKSSGSFSSEATGRPRKGSHKLMKTQSGPHALNGLHNQHREANNIVENGVSADNKTEAEVIVDPLKMLEERAEGQTGNEQDSRDAPPDTTKMQEVNVQSQYGDKDSTTNSVPGSDSTEEIFKLCEQIALQTSSSVRHLCPTVHHSSLDRSSRPARLRPRPASAVLDLRRPEATRDYYSLYAEVGSLCRRRRRPAPSVHLSPGPKRAAARTRPCSVIETSVTRETQFTELHHRALSPPLGCPLWSPLSKPPCSAAVLCLCPAAL